MTPLPQAFLDLPLAHRGLHDGNIAVPENSRAAVNAAIAAGYGIEIDVQVTADGEAVVFHDFTLDRMTTEPGPVVARTQADLRKVTLKPNGEGIPTLAEILAIVRGRVPLLVEVKDETVAADTGPRALEAAVARAIDGYNGPLAVMSFNPGAIRHVAKLAPGTPVGITTCGYKPKDYPDLEPELRDRLRQIADFDPLGASFVSHEAVDLGAAPVQALKARGVPILCWTIRSQQAEDEARKIADNITFEGYSARLP